MQEDQTLTAPAQHSVSTIKYYGANHCIMAKFWNWQTTKKAFIYTIIQNSDNSFSEVMRLLTPIEIKNAKSGLQAKSLTRWTSYLIQVRLSELTLFFQITELLET